MTGIRRRRVTTSPPPAASRRLRGPGLEIPDGLHRCEAVHVGHLEVHQHEVEALAFEGFQRGLPGLGHHDGMPLALHQADRQPLVHDVVLRQQDAETMPALPEHVAGHEVRRLAWPGPTRRWPSGSCRAALPG